MRCAAAAAAAAVVAAAVGVVVAVRLRRRARRPMWHPLASKDPCRPGLSSRAPTADEWMD